MKCLNVLLMVGMLAMNGSAAPQPPKPRNAAKALVVNNDGFSVFFRGDCKTPDDIRKLIHAYSDTQVAVLEWCFLAGSRANYRSKVTELIGDGVVEFPRRGDKQAHQTLRKIAESGVDLTQIVANACHEAGILCYASMRMNGDYSGRSAGKTLPRMMNSRFWWEHPQYRVRGPKGQDQTKLSFAFPEVRDFKLGLLREVVQCDLDGVNLDFLRHPPFFGYEEPLIKAFKEKFGEDARDLKAGDKRWQQFRCAVMGDFLRSVRGLLDDAARRKGRRLGLSARVDWREYRAWGCDIEQWLKEGLLDYLVVAQHSLGGYEFDLAPFVKMAKDSGCAIYFGEEAVTSGHDLTAEEDKSIAEGKMKQPMRNRLSLDQYRVRAAKWYAAGADGIHLFNEGDLFVFRVLGNVEFSTGAAK